ALERDPLAVGRPGGRLVVALVGGEAGDARPVGAHRVDLAGVAALVLAAALAVAVPHARERDALSVGRPRPVRRVAREQRATAAVRADDVEGGMEETV